MQSISLGPGRGGGGGGFKVDNLVGFSLEDTWNTKITAVIKKGTNGEGAAAQQEKSIVEACVKEMKT